MNRGCVFMRWFSACICMWLLFCHVNSLRAAPVHIVAAENMYGNIAQQIGGKYVQVETVLNNPDQDPHVFELPPRLSQSIRQADLVIMNGLGYDVWMQRLITTSGLSNQKVISVQALLNRSDGDNPHLWYDLQAIQSLSKALVQRLSVLVPEQRDLFFRNQVGFLRQLEAIRQRIQKIRLRHASISVAATEPVFGLMARQMGFIVLEEPYQWVMMNGGEPAPQEIARFIRDLETHRIKILFYNSQVSNEATENLKNVANHYGVPVIGVEEIMPASVSYQEWIGQVLDKIESVVQSIPE